MSTTTCTARLDAGSGSHGARGGRSAPGVLGVAVTTLGGSFAATAPFAHVATDAAAVVPRRPRRAVTTLGALAWIPALALTLVVFALVGVVAGVSALSVWTWRSLSPARARRGPAETPSTSPRDEAPDGSPAGRGSRRVVRDRTVGYDA